MPDEAGFVARTVTRIGEVPAAAWDACAGSGNPFVGHAFLSCLEDSRSAVEKEGWGPRHLLLEDAGGRLLGCAPLYLKSHSYGEYVFDHGWGDAYERAGGRYYPKLLCGIPFTPVPGPRLLVRPDADDELAEAGLGQAMIAVAERLGLSSIHVNFLPERQWTLLGELGFIRRTGQQFHWLNQGFASFDDFLGALSSRKRKNIRKEREQVAAAGVRMHVLAGDDLKPHHWDVFYRFYRDTTDRKWGWDYLTRAFFDLMHDRMRNRVVLVLAEHDGEWVGGALNLLGDDALYGRNWGCVEHFRFLHFEACYYQAIEFAIARGLARVEAGAQGQHKIQRGYLPVPTYSAHWIADAGFRRAVADFVRRERAAVGAEMAVLGELSPFRRTGG